MQIAESVCKRLNKLGEENEFWRNGEYNKFVADWALINHMQESEMRKTIFDLKALDLNFKSPD
jgi:hypothetical protein